ncbi:MAG: M4 family metallopeptidase [Chloroflexi bacterium]|nr:M4 family metallopeptidase [Chloroflexota bacterium]
MKRSRGPALGAVFALTALLATSLVAPAVAADPDRGPNLDRALSSELRGAGGNIARHAATGQVRFVSGSAPRPAATSETLGRPSTPQAAARRFMARYGSLFGIADASRDLRVARSERAIGGNTFVRYQQLHRGVPVLGAEIAVQVDAAGNVISANGEASPDLRVDVTPALTSAAATRNALSAIAKARGVARGDLTASVPSLWIYDPALLGGRALPFTRLVWRMDVTNRAGDMRELVLIDAARGNVALHFDQIAEAKNRLTCDANSTATKYPCTTAQAARTETSGPSAVADVNNAHVFSGHTYDFFFNRFGRDSLDGAGMALVSTVRYCPDSFNCPYQNAFWDGSQMVYGTGYANADDVVGHELAHGVTDHTSSLFYYYQSGAINEAISDIFGEFVDLANGADGAGGSGAGVRWLLGEDLPIGAIRDMENPPLTDQPDKMTSSLYWDDPNEQDGGGVHYNSGVANKAAFLMVDGQTFNGQTVTGLGIDKAAAVWYRVEAQYLGSASDYADLGAALNQACSDLVGTTPKNGAGSPSASGAFTAANCTEVSQAVLATEMALQPTAPDTSAPEAAVCTSGTPVNAFFDDLENTASGNWTTAAIGTSPITWYYPQTSHSYDGWDPTYATSGDTNIWGDNLDATSDSVIRMTSGVTIPAGGLLHFKHAYGFEDGYDGGIVEYQIGSGTWTNAGPLGIVNGYNGPVDALGGINGFTAESNGYISSRIDLSSLAGQSVKFRFRIGTDYAIFDYGWFIDDVRIYTCTTSATRQPDGWIAVGTGAFVGDNVYNTTALGQKKSGSAPVGSSVSFKVSIQNDGSVAETFTAQAAGSTTSYTVKYLHGATDVTSAVVAGTYQTPSLAPGGSHLLKVKVKVKSSAAVGSKVSRLVTITSVGDATKKDAVKYIAKRS